MKTGKETNKQTSNRCETNILCFIKDQENSGGRAQDNTEEMLVKLGIKIRKGRYLGRYSKNKRKKGHRGGKNRRRKQGFLSEEDFKDESRTGVCGPEVAGETGDAVKVEEGPDSGGSRGMEPEGDEDAGKKTATKMKKTGSRSRTHVAKVEGGRLLTLTRAPGKMGELQVTCPEVGRGGTAS